MEQVNFIRIKQPVYKKMPLTTQCCQVKRDGTIDEFLILSYALVSKPHFHSYEFIMSIYYSYVPIISVYTI